MQRSSLSLFNEPDKTIESQVGQTIDFCRLFPRACGPQSLMKNWFPMWGRLPTCGRLPIGLVELQRLGGLSCDWLEAATKREKAFVV